MTVHHLTESSRSNTAVNISLSPLPPLQVKYFEVGNLNTNTFPAAANLPTYVRENYEFAGNHGNKNTDRIIISLQVRTRVVETVYVTEHDGGGCGRFSADRTYEISCELIRALQSPQLDITTFLTQMGYYSDIQCQQLDVDMEPFNYDQLVQYFVNLSSQNSRHYSDAQAIWRPKALGQSSRLTGWERLHKGKGAVSISQLSHSSLHFNSEIL